MQADPPNMIRRVPLFICIPLLLFIPLALRDCGGSPSSQEYTQQAKDRITADAATQKAQDTAQAATQNAQATRRAAALTKVAATGQTPATTVAAAATATELERVWRTPEEAALGTFHDWAAKSGVPYQHEHADVLSNDGTLASVRVSAELKDTPNGPWIAKQAQLDCKTESGSWSCTTYLQFFPAATATPGS